VGLDASTSLSDSDGQRQAARRSEEQKIIAEQFVSLDLACPVCKSKFETLQTKMSAVRPRRGGEYDQFMYTEYDGPNPNHYSVAVCPSCLYAAYAKEFEEAPVRQKALADLQTRTQRWGEYRFAGLRDFATVQASFELAVHCCEYRRHGRYGQQAALRLQMAWLSHERGQQEDVQIHLTQAYEDYQHAYAEEQAASVVGEIRLTYILGLLSMQLGNAGDAVHWFEQTTKHREIGKHPEMQRRARERWHELRNAAR
jgi:uncharacterized protein (DUF2225 family)